MEPTITRKTKIQIIEETLTYYSEDPVGRRSVESEGSRCVYYGPDGKRCAYSRCWKEGISVEEVVNRYEWKDVESLIYSEEVENVDDLLKEEYQGYDTEFWGDLQKLHGMQDYWTETGISLLGQKYANKLLPKYKDQ